MSHNSLQSTPYERFLRQNLDDEKKRLDLLNRNYAKAGPLKKIQLQRELDLLNQNIMLLSSDLEHYLKGLDWLREPSKERDEKAESLKPVPIEALTGHAAQPKPSAPQARPPVSIPVTRAPTIGRPVGSPVGVQQKPIGNPQLAKEVGQAQSAQDNQAPKPTAPRVGAPLVGKPIGAPVVGKPVGTPIQAPRVGTPIKKKEDAETKEEQTNQSGSSG